MPKIFISTVPFGEFDQKPLNLLQETGWEYQVNPLNRKLTPEEVAEFARDADGLIAGTEDISIVLKSAKKLRVVSRVGIGLDSVPLKECKEKGITVTYTPDAVTMAVVEMTISLMISGTRQIIAADRNFRKGNWNRLQGKRLGESIIGLIGFGRIGSNVARILSEFHPKKVLVSDIKDYKTKIATLRKEKSLNIEQVSREDIYQHADIISLHVPLCSSTRNLICMDTLRFFRQDAFLINTSRGGIVNESDLYTVLKGNNLLGAAIDAFEHEPYNGPLTELNNIILTQHMGSCSYDCRAAMETQATEDMIRFFKKEPLLQEVPEEEYSYQEVQ
jgi:D-3-phosphoglycerate dehydrogenase / 2-oxoglutarate reductase